jgi:hypothetical protein
VVPQPEATSGSLADKFLSLPSTYWISEHEGGSWLSAFSSPCSQDAVRHFCFPGGLLEPQTPCRFIQVAESLPVLTCGNLWARCNGNVPNPSGDSLQSQKRLSVRGGLYPSSSHSPGVLSSDLPICVQDTFGRSPSTMWQVTFKPWLFLPCPSHSMVFTPSYRSSLKTLHLAVFLLQWSVQSWRQGQGDWTIALPHTLFFFFFCSAGDQIHGLVYARQASPLIYILSSQFLRQGLAMQARLAWNSQPPSLTWDYRCEWHTPFIVPFIHISRVMNHITLLILSSSGILHLEKS